MSLKTRLALTLTALILLGGSAGAQSDGRGVKGDNGPQSGAQPAGGTEAAADLAKKLSNAGGGP